MRVIRSIVLSQFDDGSWDAHGITHPVAAPDAKSHQVTAAQTPIGAIRAILPNIEIDDTDKCNE